jgi:hypothetical protein
MSFPRSMFMPQVKLNWPAFFGVNSTAVVLNAGSGRLMPKSPKTTVSEQPEVSCRSNSPLGCRASSRP